ncbi:hypothetical protein GWK47_021039 [Chionoecetes opilio]|uniref:Uncharacterized protein n=1 Tax=Chionoecetes opilio TaxID=41210 RepID=A0A8J4XXU7_CHIOP|nr:hypothetical protein GWK47_021039 [Chionoecetes opilio]
MKPETSAGRVYGLATTSVDTRSSPERYIQWEKAGEAWSWCAGCRGITELHTVVPLSTHCRRILRLPAAQQRRQKRTSQDKAALISAFAADKVFVAYEQFVHSPASGWWSQLTCTWPTCAALAALFGGIPDNGPDLVLLWLVF